ncbi:MAG: cyclic nucleotide-binding domain-containing protein [Actinomycetota bacterium]
MAKPKLDVILASVPLFEGLTKRHLKQIADIATVDNYMEGATIVKEGDPGNSFFVVLSGQAKVVVKKRTVNKILPGDHFGEISLLDGEPRSASVITETPMTVASIDRKGFERLLQHDPGLSLAMLRTLARRLRTVNRAAGR